jgi:hypothetical protein
MKIYNNDSSDKRWYFLLFTKSLPLFAAEFPKPLKAHKKNQAGYKIYHWLDTCCKINRAVNRQKNTIWLH